MALIATVVAALGRSVKFPLMTEIHALGLYTKMYHDEFGTYPTTWQEFEEYFGPTRKLGGVLDSHERFAFVTAPVFLRAYPTDERILLISREPFRPPTEEMVPFLDMYYRTVGERVYVAVVQQGDNVFVRRMKSEWALKVFGEAGAELPQPSGLGLYPHERAHRAQTVALWLGVSAGCIACVWVIAVRKKRRTEKTLSPDGHKPSE